MILEMVSSILLLCKYGSLTLVVKVVRGFKFEDLVASICKKWNNLVSRRLHLLYVVSEHSNCLFENDDDFDSMVALAVAYGVSCVEVSVNEAGSSSRVDHSNSSEIGECSTLQIDEDPLEKFCPHHETKRLSANWAYLISHKKGVDTSSYIDPFYTTDAFRLSYELPIYPIHTLEAPEVTKETAVIHPPKTRRPRGRPKVARIRSRGEKVRQIRCLRCKQLGKHNRKSCKEPCD
ncbi:hypothetical protein Vadar_016625 [Vaccinium darrowii]|uniref:Uncharacterized protein n=1 Tax=Vaccinium darrowii TaxID=229202 RepID=A0ACB7X1Q7_9ERIC|nr:hypothetical protein Vadar_016625 [Vaccinium darrowii]